MARKIHTEPCKRYELGKPVDDLVAEMLKSTNTGNLSSNWNHTDMVRYAIAELWKKTGKPLPKGVKTLLKPFYKDLDGVHSG